MFCRNCSSTVKPKADRCEACNLHPLKGNSYCPICCSKTEEAHSKCPSCSLKFPQLKGTIRKPDQSPYKNETTLILCLLLGMFGVHRFYTKNYKSALIQLFTLGGLGLWAMADTIQIIGENFKDGEGRTLEFEKSLLIDS